MASFPRPDDIVLTHFIVSDDDERSRRFYTDVTGVATRRRVPEHVSAPGTRAGHPSTTVWPLHRWSR